MYCSGWRYNFKIRAMGSDLDLSIWRPVRFGELKTLSDSELSGLFSNCWKNGEQRCSCIGIRNLKISETNTVTWSDVDGDPEIDLWEDIDEDFELHNVGDGTWNYGLYIKR